MTTTSPHMKPIRNKLTAAAAACALLTTAGMATASAASASAAPPRTSSAALRTALHRDLSRYLTARRTAEHISAVSLRVTFPGSRPAISLATGTTRYDGGAPVSASALWQIGSNTKAFTAVILLQLEAEGKLSISDPIGKWLPQYPAWRHITIRQLLDMTSRIPDYLYQPAFDTTFAADPATRFTAARLVSYVAGLPARASGLPLHQHRLHPRADDHREGHPRHLRQPAHPADPHPAAAAHHLPGALHLPPVRRRRRCRPGTSTSPAAHRRCWASAMPPLALTWAQAAGGIVSSLADMTTWDRALYQGRLLPPRQQHQLESLVSEATGKPIRRTTAADPAGYGLGVQQVFNPQTGIFWAYEGQAFGARVIHYYFPRTGLLIAVAANSSDQQRRPAPT